jgi:hypothetical protein
MTPTQRKHKGIWIYLFGILFAVYISKFNVKGLNMPWREDDFGGGGGQGYGGPSMDEVVLKIQQKMARGSGSIWRL